MDDIKEYHQRTKHRLNQYAAGPGYLDWETQPNPFRRYEGAERIELPLIKDDPASPYDALFGGARVEPRRFNLESVSLFLKLSLSLAAWKEYQGARWAVRVNPSSGNLHAEEGYIITGGAPGLEEGVYHYDSGSHALEKRLGKGAEAMGLMLDEYERRVNPFHSHGIFLVGLTSIHWREAWKYGERAFRYCQLDVGHALLCLRFAAASLGWRARLATGASDGMAASLMGISREEDYIGVESEYPDAMVIVSTGPDMPGDLDETFDGAARHFLLNAARDDSWRGRASVVSAGHAHEWPVMDEAARMVFKPATEEDFTPPPDAPLLPLSGCDKSAAHIIMTRRSGQAYDGASSMPAEKFVRITSALIPRADKAPWDMIPWLANVHPVFFVHRVEGFAPGIYILVRRPGEEETLKAALGGKYAWTPPKASPEGLPLYLLKEMDARGTAAMISCQQDIAGDGIFSAGMLARFDGPLAIGPWWYRRIHWEAGAVGQALYLEAEAAGFRGTGIGCYFDDVFHTTLGLEGDVFQDIYHFTVGASVEDERVITKPPYEGR
ncbi:MAG: SagB/ThcOx family dehydrogenase [Nitrospinota bacterium]|nr:SagB/ThcOx family dehydrogenase [Nitrospinota bacterium]